ncbi:lipid phosphate phosphatase 2-like isoform X2 [Asparagus officinalis]|uniref:lipid phosphate phosphatase 2-like isoform X2 n=1 Tax=Asparagus officinalis TaxID=4686 RepID=UPI00098E1194|nr:lipid phosphate phosphatase 2-like isoform X2 [Asparagus officinalis]
MQSNERRMQSHTVQSHGFKLAKTHLHDWVILFLLLGLMIGLGVMAPFYRFVGKDMMSDLRYPHKSSTVPFWAVPVIAVLLPVAIFVAFYFRRRDVYDLHHAILGIFFSVLITGVLTNAIKDAVGRPRPDFFWRCFPDGKELYDRVTGRVICHGEKSLMNAGHKSFPSGHTSCLSFFSLYLSGKIKVFDRRGHVAKLCIVLLPLLIACLIGISRVDDYRHHWEDVFVGGILGLIVATFCYLQFFPPPYHIHGWGPHAYFHMLESLRSAENQQSEQRTIAGPSGVNDDKANLDNGSSEARRNGANLPDLESGTV